MTDENKGLPPIKGPPAPKLGEVRPKVKWEVKIEEKKFTMKSLKSFKPLKDISTKRDWSKIKDYAQSESGSAGVFFCLSEDDELFVLKGGSTVGEEIFASEMADLLGVYTSKMRMIEYSPFDRKIREWKDIKLRLETLSSHNSKVQKELNRGFFIIMEYIPNVGGLENMKSEDFSSEVLKDIGRMVVLDVVLNNWDRLPTGILWDHEGNPNNMLFNPIEKRLAAIDQSTTEISQLLHKEQYLNYLEKVKEFTSAVLNKKGDPVTSICKCIKLHSGFDIKEEDQQFIWEGLQETLLRACKLDFMDITKTKQKVSKQLTGKDWENVWSNMMELISEDFISAVIHTMKDEYKKWEKK